MASTAISETEALLLKTSRLYGVKVRPEEVRRTLGEETQGPAFAEWAATHLQPDTLLTKEELSLYTALDRSGEVDRLAALHDLAEVQSLDEDDIRAAVQELTRSTESINKQADTLRQQQAAVSRLVNKTKDTQARRREFEEGRRRKADIDRERLASEVDGLARNLDFRIQDLEEQSDEVDSTLGRTLQGVLASDDKLLTSLQKLGRELDEPDPSDDQAEQKLRQSCMRLIKVTVETVRARLDTVYLTTQADSIANGSTRSASRGDVEALGEEVESLYAEILPVAQMAVEQEHLEPALKALADRGGQTLARSAAAVAYIDKCLDHLLVRMESLYNRVQAHRSYQAASADVFNTAKPEIEAPTSDPKPASTTMPTSPVRKRNVNTHRRSSSGLPSETPLENLLQSLAIPYDPSKPGLVLPSTLAAAVADRSAKEADVARAAQESFEKLVSAHMDDARLALQLLRDSLLAETPFAVPPKKSSGDGEGAMSSVLADPELEASITVLKEEVARARARLAEVEGLKVGAVRSEKREELIKRWG